jgi:soluble lytic murein transglycosylase
MIRGNELWALGLYTEARNEFEAVRMAVAQDAVASYRLTHYLLELGLYRSAIFAARQVLDLAGMDDAATMSAPLYFNHVRFGIYFENLILPTAQEYNFNPLFVFSVVRQESLFESFIRSSAAASGLMQIIPETGQEIASNLGWPENYTNDDLNRPYVNIRFGIDYLDSQRNTFKGDMYAALAAYNGGPGNALRWKNLAPDDEDLFVELIDFSETRDYIRRIYEIFSIYRRIYDRTP